MTTENNLTSSKPTISQTALAFITWNGMYIFFIFFNLSLIVGVYYKAYIFAPLLIMYRFLFAGNSHKKDGKPWREFSEKWFLPGKIMRSYLQLNFGELPKAFVNAEAKPDAQFILACFPHGCGSEFRVLMEGCIQNAMPNVVKKNNFRTLAASVLFQIPLISESAQWTGCIDASRKTAQKALDRGRSLLILPGGEAEQLLTTYGREKIYLSSRKGFIKLAMRKGISVVPMYVFGSSDLFYTSSFLYGPRRWLMKHFGVCIPICFGLLGSLCPLPKKVSIVFGEPMTFSMNGSDPTSVELDSAHKKFSEALVSLFDSHKREYGYGDRTLEVI